MSRDLGALPAFVRTYADLIRFAAMLDRMCGPITFMYQEGGTWWRVWPR